MQMQFFQVPAVGGEGMVEEVNRFLRVSSLVAEVATITVVKWLRLP